MAAYFPRKGDFVAITFDPRSGHERRGRRRDYPFHVTIPAGQNVTGFVMVEQVKSIDFRSRRAKRIGRAPEPVLQEVLSILDACLY